MAREMSPRPGTRLPLLAVWLLLHHVLTSAWASRFEIIPGQKMVSVPPLDAKPVDDIRQCAVLCHGLASCWAFNHLSNSTCQLLPAAPEVCQGDVNGSHLVTEPGGSFGMPSGVCARTCQQLRRLQPTAASGVYRLVGWPVPVLCDRELDGGGWTLVISSVSQTWTSDDTVSLVTGRNQQTPDIAADYSILEHGDYLLSFGTGDRFLYRLVYSVFVTGDRFLYRLVSLGPETGSSTGKCLSDRGQVPLQVSVFGTGDRFLYRLVSLGPETGSSTG